VAELEKRSRDSGILFALCGGKSNEVTSEMVGQAFAKRDRIATDVLEQTVEYLAHWLGNIIDLLEPEIIVMGGGVSAMLKPLFPRIREKLPDCCENQRACETPIAAARFGESAGIAGAAAICRDMLAKN
jgi:glucokinase